MKTIILLSLISITAFAVLPNEKNLPIGLAPEERGMVTRSAPEMTDPPVAPIHSLGEWEESEAVMTLWPNASWISAVVAHGPVKLFADERNAQGWWQNFLNNNHISTDHVSYFLTQTNSIWIRDYGPWFIVDGKGQFGMVGIHYNRPRPLDNLVTGFLSQALNLPLFRPGLVHTGGNYYNDGLGNAFSSTLVYEENPGLASTDINSRMQRYLGIDHYSTSPLAPKITIEHLDTFGKLVAPDTFVFSDFPEGSRYRADSEKYVAMLKTLTSPYGTPYKILRMKMVTRSMGGGEDYRAYLNSFISNHALYYPTYGDSVDDEVAAIYQKALPGYDIVGVDNGNTEWGDSVHCRSRNLMKKNTIFIFPTITEAKANEPIEINAEVFASPGAELTGAPVIHWKASGADQADVAMEKESGNHYRATLPAKSRGTDVSLFISATDSAGIKKTAPIYAPDMMINVTVR